MTAELLARGARVTAIDLSEEMLARARRKAPNASFVQCDILGFVAKEPFDCALLAFVLHEMDRSTRDAAIATAAAALGPGGQLALLDFALPVAGPLRWGLRAYLAAAEPPTAIDWIDAGEPNRLLARHGLKVERVAALAAGTAEVVVGVRR